MTEIQWLIQIMMDHKLPALVKEKFIARIGEVDSQRTIQVPSRPVMPVIQAQAPSTQRLMEQHEPPQGLMLPPKIPEEIITYRGNGTSTRGPKKF